MIYRKDIDGLRALAVISVIIYHLGFLKNGYLGVDIFFVISGFLITKIIYQETLSNNFSLLKFYERRIRRILPLLFSVTFVSVLLGTILLLPQDLVALSKSVIASNFSFNNILMFITSGGYWEATNDFKPLMHTWSLGIEEQFYVLYPLIFMIFRKTWIKYIGILIITVTVLSLLLFLMPGNATSKFFLLQYRFYELSFGGLAAIFISGKVKRNHISDFSQLTFVILILIILSDGIKLSNELNIIFTTILTIAILLLGEVLNVKNSWYYKIFTHPAITFLGKISFSLYMWHQVIFAFARMTVFREMTLSWALILTFLTFLLSILSYYFIENYFRDKSKIGMKSLLIWLITLLILSSGISLFVISRSGVIRNLPALDIYTNKVSQKNIFGFGESNILLTYNKRIDKLHKSFELTKNKKILVIGDSYARDAANILLESSVKNKIEVRFINIQNLYRDKINKELLGAAEFVIFSFDNFESKSIVKKIEDQWNVKLNKNKILFFGTKNFGSNFHSGYDFFQSTHFHRDLRAYYTTINSGTIATNNQLKKEWQNEYIDLISPLQKTGSNQIKLFTPDQKVISFDTAHLTKAGAQFYAKILKEDIVTILNN